MAARALLPAVRKFAPDILHSFFVYPEGYAALQLGKALSIPVIANGIGSDINNIGDPISRILTRNVLREADFLFTVSSDLRTKALAMGARPETTRTLINGCDPSVFHVADRIEARSKLRIDPSTEAVVYIGRMDLKKGLRELVQAAVALHDARPNLHVYMVGEGPDRPLVQDAITASHAAAYVHALPGCAYDDVAVWMTAADLVTLPSYMEGCPNVILEALACGRPVVATQVGGIPEIMSDECGCLVPPRDPVSLARALASVLDRTWDAAAISASRGRSWTHVADELLQIFHTVLGRRQTQSHAR